MFDILLLGLENIDKDSPQDSCRLNFEFQYHNQNRDCFLSEVQFREIVFTKMKARKRSIE